MGCGGRASLGTDRHSPLKLAPPSEEPAGQVSCLEGNRGPGARVRLAVRHAGSVEDGLRVTPGVTLPRTELVWRFSRSSGPGGQSVNTTDSRVELLFDLSATEALPEHLKSRALERLGARLVDGVLSVTASEHRSQFQNRRAAAARLAALLAEAIAPPVRPRRPTRPSRRAVQARLDDKRRRSLTKRGRRTTDD